MKHRARIEKLESATSKLDWKVYMEERDARIEYICSRALAYLQNGESTDDLSPDDRETADSYIKYYPIVKAYVESQFTEQEIETVDDEPDITVEFLEE